MINGTMCDSLKNHNLLKSAGITLSEQLFRKAKG
jgi:hypothetical protein